MQPTIVFYVFCLCLLLLYLHTNYLILCLCNCLKLFNSSLAHFQGRCFSLSSSYVVFFFSNLYLGYCPTRLHRLPIYLHSLDVAFLWLSEDLGCSASPRCSKLDIFICTSNEVSPPILCVRLCALFS